MAAGVPLIHDGDHGNGDFFVTLLAAASPWIDLQGVISCQGNVTPELAAQNAIRALDMLEADSVPVAIGQRQPFARQSKQGDDAFGSDGLGNAAPPAPSRTPARNGMDWLIATLQEATARYTICATGPLTNLATALARAPDIVGGIEQVVCMGGCLAPLGPHERQGNITPYAEFNFYMDPEAAAYVCASDIPLTLFPLDVTQQLVFTPCRMEQVQSYLGSYGALFARIWNAAEALDGQLFGASGSFLHDEHTLLSLIDPSLYTYYQTGLTVVTQHADVAREGQVLATPDAPAVDVADSLLDADHAFGMLLHQIKAGLSTE